MWLEVQKSSERGKEFRFRYGRYVCLIRDSRKFYAVIRDAVMRQWGDEKVWHGKLYSTPEIMVSGDFGRNGNPIDMRRFGKEDKLKLLRSKYVHRVPTRIVKMHGKGMDIREETKSWIYRQML